MKLFNYPFTHYKYNNNNGMKCNMLFSSSFWSRFSSRIIIFPTPFFIRGGSGQVPTYEKMNIYREREVFQLC